MDPRKLLQEDDAVSPVIGVILMVAITVILAAVIASFVLNLGPDTATTPTASFSAEKVSSGSDLKITMDSGENIDASKVSLSGSDSAGKTWKQKSTNVSEITAGESITVTIGSSSKIKLIYTDGDTSSTMQTFDV